MVEPILLTDAARFYALSPHQTKAWEWLQERIDQPVLDEFATLYRAAPEVKYEPAPTTGYINPELM